MIEKIGLKEADSRGQRLATNLGGMMSNQVPTGDSAPNGAPPLCGAVKSSLEDGCVLGAVGSLEPPHPMKASSVGM